MRDMMAQSFGFLANALLTIGLGLYGSPATCRALTWLSRYVFRRWRTPLEKRIPWLNVLFPKQGGAGSRKQAISKRGPRGKRRISVADNLPASVDSTTRD